MPARDAVANPRVSTPRPSIALPIVLWFAIAAALLPLLRVIRWDSWMGAAIGIAAIVLLAGWIGRACRIPAVVVSLGEIVVAGLTLTAVFARDTSLLVVVPSIETFRAIPGALDGAVRQIVEGAAPLNAGPDLAFVIAAACALLAIALDHVAVTARMPLLAAIALIAVYLIPAIAVPSGPRVTEFIVFGIALLALLATETRVRERLRLRTLTARGPRPRAASVVAAAVIGAVAVAAALIVAPALPQPTRGTGTGTFVAGSAIDASLSLGENLRQPASIEVLRVDSDAPSPPYLRAVTLSDFDGVTWEHDRSRGAALDENSFAPLAVAEGIAVEEFTTEVEVVNYVSPWLPIPYAATSVDGLEGEWVGVEDNRTVLTRSASPVGQSYTVTTQVAQPTLEQIRSARAAGATGVDGLLTSLEADESQLAPIRAAVAEVTAGLTSDYDRLVALQTWFRSAFQYSLDAPVEEGFDGTGIDAITAFLEERTGYCVHFASAFAVMARSMDMPSRIVVGYLPGTLSADFTAGESYFSVASTQLHAWPEVWFEGIGWVPFEPTSSLGTPTRFAPGTTGGTQPGGSDDAPESAPETPETQAPSQGDAPEIADGDVAPTGDATAQTPAVPLTALWLLVVLLLAVPATIRALIRATRIRALAQPSTDGASNAAVAAWHEIIDTAVDLGIRPPPGETPRAFGDRLVRDHGASAEAVGVIVSAIEWASYADAVGGHASDASLADAVRDVRGQLRRHAPAGRRVLAVVLPRSLAMRAAVGAGVRSTA